MVDFHNAYTDFTTEKGITISADKWMTFDRIESLSGTMTYRPSGIKLKFEPFHNILNWSKSSITAILDNKVYLSHMAGLRTTSLV